MLEELKKDLAQNFIEDTESIINDYIARYSSIASNKSNRKETDKKLMPYIYNAVKQSYLRRGDEGTLSSSEGSISQSYADIEEKLATDVRDIRLVL